MEHEEYLSPAVYEAEEWSRPDEMAMFFATWRMARAVLDSRPDAVAVDLCCGTGIPALGIVSHPNLREYTGVDAYDPVVQFARLRFQGVERVRMVCDDALAYLRTCQPVDLAVLSSAYHHIEHGSKADFLRLVADRLAPGGRAIIAENILAPYADVASGEYLDRVRDYYDGVVAAARHTYRALPAFIEGLIRQNVVVTVNGLGEHKVDMETFRRDLEGAGLTIIAQELVWSATWLEPKSHVAADGDGTPGNFVFEVARIRPTTADAADGDASIAPRGVPDLVE